MRKIETGMMAGVFVVGMLSGALAHEKLEQKETWADTIKIGGDVRFRYQRIDEESKESRDRWRFRARLGLEGHVNELVKANVRLVTNTGDPTSDNQTMDNAFDDKNAAMDQAFLTYTPITSLSLRFGKMSQPWIAVDDLVVSCDLNPEGMAANATLGSDAIGLLLHGGAFVVDERAADKETMLYTGQAAVKLEFRKKDYVMAGASVYAYENIENYELQVNPANSFGNATRKLTSEKDGVETTTFLYDTGYTIIEGFVEALLDLGVPVKLVAQYIVNTDADKYDTGYLGSATVKLPAGFAVGYQYRYLEKDATLGCFAESGDFGNGTDVEGHILYLGYDIGKNFNIKVQYAMGQNGIDDGRDINTFKIDLACKF